MIFQGEREGELRVYPSVFFQFTGTDQIAVTEMGLHIVASCLAVSP